MPRVNIKELGLTPQQANDMFSGLKPDEIGAKVEELKTVSARNQSTASSFTEKVNQIKGLEENKYLDSAVGPNYFARLSPLSKITGGKQDFVAGIQQLTNQETMDKLLQLKQAGGTLGALNESEGQMLKESATKINNWAIKDKNGNITGYNVSEDAFKGELARLRNLAQKAVDTAKGVSGGGNAGVTSNGLKYTIEQ